MSSTTSITPAAALGIARRHVESNAWPWSQPKVVPEANESYEIWTRHDWWGDQVRVVVDARTGLIRESSFVASCLHQHHEA